MPSLPRLVLPLVLTSLVPGQGTPTTNPPAATTNAQDPVIRTMLAAQRELRWLLDRNAALERALAQQRREHERETEALRRQVETERARAADLAEQQAVAERKRAEAEADHARTTQQRNDAQARRERASASLQSQLADATARRDQELQRLQQENLRLQAESRNTATELEALRRAMTEASRAKTTTDSRTTPPRSGVPERDAKQAGTAEPPDPPPGTRTPRRRVKID